jgi:hypothetical protein
VNLHLLTFSWQFADDLTAIAHKHLIPNDIPCPMGELRREQMAAFRSISQHLELLRDPPRAPPPCLIVAPWGMNLIKHQ